MQIRAYHGSGSLFEKFEQSKSRIPNDFYGGGVCYSTDNLQIAHQYAKAMTKKTTKKEEIIYTLEITFRKLFDVDTQYSGSELKKFISNDVEGFARGAGLLKFGVDKYSVISTLKRGDMTLPGNIIFKGISNGMVTTAKGRETLKRLGYDGLRYNGGLVTGHIPHSVYLSYHANQINIVDVTIGE